jgi:hypothetical protein
MLSYILNLISSFGIWGYIIAGILFVPALALCFKCIEWAITIFIKSFLYLISVAAILYTIYVCYVCYLIK